MQDLAYHFRVSAADFPFDRSTANRCSQICHRGCDLNDNVDGTFTVVNFRPGMNKAQALKSLPKIISKRTTPIAESPLLAPQIPSYVFHNGRRTPIWGAVSMQPDVPATEPDTTMTGADLVAEDAEDLSEGPLGDDGTQQWNLIASQEAPYAIETWRIVQQHGKVSGAIFHDPAIKDIIHLERRRDVTLRNSLYDCSQPSFLFRECRR
jgi:hypothetical protein